MAENKIINVRLVDKNTDKLGTVVFAEGKITDVFYDDSNDCTTCNDTNIIDGKGMVLMPAFTDLHTHFRDPGFTYKEDLETGSKAAVKGGYTTVVLMANTNPVCSTSEIYLDLKNRAAEIGLVDVEPVIAISEGLQGQDSSHLNELDPSVKFLSDDGKGVMNSKMMEDALLLAKNNDLTIMSHAEDHSFSSTDMRKAENYMTLRDLYACEMTNGKLHMCHVSTKEAVEMIISARKKGINVTCEVAPHHIFLTDEIKYRVNPPLRKKEDIDAIISAIREGYIDAIATDHAPHSKEDKENGAPGICGIETSFSICLTKLVKEEGMSLQKLSELMSFNPNKIMNLEKGLIKKGYEADLVLVDVNKKIKIDVKDFASKSQNSPIDGYELFGEVVTTIKSGKIVYTNN